LSRTRCDGEVASNVEEDSELDGIAHSHSHSLLDEDEIEDTEPCIESSSDHEKARPAKHWHLDLTTTVDEGQECPLGEEANSYDDIATPPTRASKAKRDLGEFPFPTAAGTTNVPSWLAAQRYPSRLLPHHGRSLTPRRHQLMTSTLSSPDRFIPNRLKSPTKEQLFSNRHDHMSLVRDPYSPGRVRRTQDQDDPFGSERARTTGHSERFVTMRRPLTASRPHVNQAGHATVVSDTTTRAVSAGAVWSVGGTIVTEGVASTSDGRGGRVTSGTSAPHYNAGFLQQQQSSGEEQLRHGHRLAHAMDMQPDRPMLIHDSSSVSCPTRSSVYEGKSRVIWRDSA
jgi:hypothetical protein